MHRDSTASSIEGIYEAASGILSWEECLARVANLLQTEVVFFELYDPQRVPAGFRHFCGDIPDLVASYDDFISNHRNPRLDWLGLNPGADVASDLDILSRREIDRHPFYQEFHKPQTGTPFNLMADVYGTSAGWFNINAHYESGMLTQDEDVRQRLAVLVTHLRRVSMLMDNVSKFTDDLFVHTFHPSIELDANLNILNISESAHKILEVVPELAIVRRKLSTTKTRLSADIRRMIDSVRSFSNTHQDLSIKVNKWVTLSVYPIQTHNLFRRGVVLYLSADPIVTLHLMLKKYDLSPTEIMVCQQFYQRGTAQYLISGGRMTGNTLKTHLKSIFGKLNVRSQARLVHFLLLLTK